MNTIDKGFAGVIFDLDGTLLDTVADIGNAANSVLEERGFPGHLMDRYREFIGEGVRVLMARALPEGAAENGLLDDCVEEFSAAYSLTWNATTRPFPGISALLDRLASRGIRMAVLSNKPHEFTDRCVGELLSRWQFGAVVGQREGLPRKPDPTGALEIARSFEIPPARILYVGDSGIDMRTATAAGMFPIGVLWGLRDGRELRATGARMLVEHPEEIIAALTAYAPR